VEIRAGASFGESHFAVGMILWVVFKNSLGRDRFKSIIVTTFTLKQLSLPSSRAQVTWGGAEKEAKAQGCHSCRCGSPLAVLLASTDK
jgi:hypothetical protein